MRIAFLGSGNVATHFAQAFRSRGAEVCQVWSPHFTHAERLARLVGAAVADSLDCLCADVYFLAVSDDALCGLALCFRRPGALVVHTSGATPADVLAPISPRHGVLWSPQSFVRDEPMDYDRLPFCVEGADESTAEQIERLAALVSPRVFRATLQQRQYLHLAAVLVNNFVSGLYCEAQRICDCQHLPFDLLEPIVLTTAQRAARGEVRNRLTGPAVRRDSKTIAAHRDLIADDPSLLELYDLMTALLQTISRPHD